MYSPCGKGVEVLLKTRFEAARFSGHRKPMAGGFPLSFIIKPLTSKRLPQKTGVATSSLLLVTMSSRQKMYPFAGSSEARDLSVQTINCHRPLDVITIG